MLLYRLGPEGLYATTDPDHPDEPAGSGAPRPLRMLLSDPFDVRPGGFEWGRRIDPQTLSLLPPVVPGKIIGIGRNYRAHAEELGNPMPTEPLLFLKATSSLLGPNAPVVLPPESAQVEYEGEVAVVVRSRLCRAGAEEAAAAVLGVTCACDVTARDLQKKDGRFARAKSFDTFCPLGPAIQLDCDLADLQVVTRLNGEERQRGNTRDMAYPIVDLLVYTSRMMTLEPGDVVLTGTPAGVGRLADGDRIEVEVSGVGVLSNPVEAWRQGA